MDSIALRLACERNEDQVNLCESIRYYTMFRIFENAQIGKRDQ